MISLVRPRGPGWAGLAAFIMLSAVVGPADASSQVDPNAACVKLEIFTRPGSDQCERAVAFLRQLEQKRPGIRVDVIDVAADKAALQRLKDLATRSRIAFSVPTIVAMGQVVIGFRDDATTGRQIEGLLNVEIFIRNGCPRCADAMPYIQGIQPRFPGLRVITYETTTDVYAQNRIQELARWYNTTAPGMPLFHVGGRLIVGWNGIELTGSEIETILRNHCGPCTPPPSATPARAPSTVTTPSTSATPAPAPTPAPSTTPAPTPEAPKVTEAPAPTPEPPPGPAPTVAPEPPKASDEPAPTPAPTPPPATTDPSPAPAAPAPPLTEPGGGPPLASRSAVRPAPPAGRDRFSGVIALGLIAFQTPPGGGGTDDLGLPPEADLPPEASSTATTATGPARVVTAEEANGESRSVVKVPLFGTLDVRRLGMPAFTFLIGLIDGFNPCAMWVLVFLLSVLAGLNDRRKLVIVAGTFVIISGLAYFVFMAAWLNVFRMIGLVRWAQVALGVLAVGMGAIHIKDFFAFKKGVTLSIPESAKPGIYAKVRQIAAAESLWVALGTAIVMAVLVNMVELLCTAGLPALYTSILSYQGHSRLVEYLYLGLYILAYMFDDAILLLVVAVTLSRRRLQEQEGRWLKLVSGVVILALGLVMLFAPTWLV